MNANPNARKWVYVGQVVIGAALAILVAVGFIDQGMSDQITGGVNQIVAGLGGLALVAGGSLARRNLSPAPATIGADGVAVITGARHTYAKASPLPSITEIMQQMTEVEVAARSAVERRRRDLEQRLGQG